MSARGPYAKGEAKRKEILRVALEVVAEMGCRSASNREIARRSGLSQAGLAHYFGSREELYMALLRSRDERDTAEFWNPQPNIEGFLALIDHNTQVPGLVQLYIEFSAEASIGLHPAHGFFTERYDWVRRNIAQAVRDAQATGSSALAPIPTRWVRSWSRPPTAFSSSGCSTARSTWRGSYAASGTASSRIRTG
ncbi:TetR/AcrR family transcriptional regulator [Tessaracoccus sp.]|uniref:TetR/AcrR family transcriptional regulator n=1 Tax=Tessaracoccus sp. TaxID=1971211 RepID=UPI00263311D7|nr:TetR/AcrR family transcriptional regulator [Tessaracoccus sp.]